MLMLPSCSKMTSPPPTATNPDGQFLMVMYDCQGDCEEPAVGSDGRFYRVIYCEEVDSGALGGAIAVPDPDSPVPVPYVEAKTIEGIEPAEAVALGPGSPSGCERESGWWAALSLDHMDDAQLKARMRALAP